MLLFKPLFLGENPWTIAEARRVFMATPGVESNATPPPEVPKSNEKKDESPKPDPENDLAQTKDALQGLLNRVSEIESRLSMLETKDQVQNVRSDRIDHKAIQAEMKDLREEAQKMKIEYEKALQNLDAETREAIVDLQTRIDRNLERILREPESVQEPAPAQTPPPIEPASPQEAAPSAIPPPVESAPPAIAPAPKPAPATSPAPDIEPPPEPDSPPSPAPTDSLDDLLDSPATSLEQGKKQFKESVDQLKALFNGKKFDEAFRELPAFLQKRIIPNRSANEAQERLRNIQDQLSQDSPNLSNLTDKLLWLDGMVGIFKEYQTFSSTGLNYASAKGLYSPTLFDDHFSEAGAILNNAFFDTAGGVGGKGSYAELVAARFGFHPEQGTLTAYFTVKVKGYPDSESVSTGNYAISVPLEPNPETAVAKAMRQFVEDKDIQKTLKRQFRKREQAIGRRDDYEASRAEARDQGKEAPQEDLLKKIIIERPIGLGPISTEAQRILVDFNIKIDGDKRLIFAGKNGEKDRAIYAFPLAARMEFSIQDGLLIFTTTDKDGIKSFYQVTDEGLVAPPDIQIPTDEAMPTDKDLNLG